MRLPHPPGQQWSEPKVEKGKPGSKQFLSEAAASLPQPKVGPELLTLTDVRTWQTLSFPHICALMSPPIFLLKKRFP